MWLYGQTKAKAQHTYLLLFFFLSPANFFLTFLSNGCANIKVGGFVFDVLRQCENVL